MQIVVKEPNRCPEVRNIEGYLDEMQDICGGFIETVFLPNGMLMVVNDFGKFNDSKYNFDYMDDQIFGAAFFCKADGEEMIGLTKDEQNAVIEFLKGA